MSKRNGTKNLIPANRRSKEEVKENGRKGGIKSGEVRKTKKNFKEMCQLILDLKPPETITTIGSNGQFVEFKISEKIKEFFPDIESDEITNRLVLIYTLMKESLKGDTKAIEILRDTAGEKPIEKTIRKNINFDIEDMNEEEINEELKKFNIDE